MLMMWVAFWFNESFMLNWNSHGLQPLTVYGLQGIIFGSFLHGSMQHIANNSLPFLFLSMGVFYYYPKESWLIILTSLTLPWIGVWLFGRPAVHIGASAAIYALATFIFFSGLWKKNRYLLSTALLVVFLYGSLFWGLFPIEERISHEGHLSGAVFGILLSVILRKRGPEPTTWHWDDEDDELIPDIEVIGEEHIQSPSQAPQINIRYDYRERDSEN